MTAVDVAALEAARAAATAGPWELDPDALFASNDSGELLFDYRDVVLVEDHPDGVAQCRADGELIVAAVNAVPQLVAALRERDALRAAVEGLADEWDRKASQYLDLSRDAGTSTAHKQRAWDQYLTLQEVAADLRRALLAAVDGGGQR